MILNSKGEKLQQKIYVDDEGGLRAMMRVDPNLYLKIEKKLLHKTNLHTAGKKQRYNNTLLYIQLVDCFKHIASSIFIFPYDVLYYGVPLTKDFSNI